jgi:hypothetical protein
MHIVENIGKSRISKSKSYNTLKVSNEFLNLTMVPHPWIIVDVSIRITLQCIRNFRYLQINKTCVHHWIWDGPNVIFGGLDLRRVGMAKLYEIKAK